MQEAFTYNSSFPEQRDQNEYDQSIHIDPEETFSNRMDLFTVNCRDKHPSAQFLVGSALYEGFRDLRYITAHNSLAKVSSNGKLNEDKYQFFQSMGPAQYRDE